MTAGKTIIYLAGPTASGKSALAVSVAKQLNTGVLSADSRQFYKYMPIATAQISEADQLGIPHFFLSFLEPDAIYSAGQFEEDALSFAREWFQSHDTLVLTGGSGLYARAFLYGFSGLPETDPEIRKQVQKDLDSQGLAILQQELIAKDPDTFYKIDIQNPRRVMRALELIRQTGKSLQDLQAIEPSPRSFNIVTIGLDWPRTKLYDRIDQRVLEMIKAGLVEEAKNLKDKGYSPNLPALRAVGFPEAFAFLNGECKEPEMINRIQQHSRNYAKRQMTWLRKEPNVNWFTPEKFEQVDEFIRRQLAYE